jgi:O-antigen ligase
VLLLAIAGSLTLITGILLNGSLAVLLLGPAVLIAGAPMLARNGKRLRLRAAALALLAMGAMLAVYLSPLQERLIASNATSFESRQKMWSTTVPAIQEHWLFGSGTGSFERVYPKFEEHAQASRTYVNHAHNDYLELALETGVPGMLLLMAFLIWWGRRAQSVWRSSSTSRYAQAATIASAAILIHSLVDYPLRTAALSAIMAALLALMAQPRSRETAQAEDLWPTRHATI